MAVAKGRLKRSSGSTCASITTKVVFVALCVFIVYMLSPSSPASSDINTTTRTAASKTKLRISNPNRDASTFHDNPGKLPKDAVKKDGDDIVKDSSSDQAADVSNRDQKEDNLDENSDKQDHLSDQPEDLEAATAADIEHLDTKDQLTEEDAIKLPDQGADLSSGNQKEDTLNENSDERDQLTEQSENLGTAAATEIEHSDTKDRLTEEIVKQTDTAVEDPMEELQGKVFEEEQHKLDEQQGRSSKESSMSQNQETDQKIATNTNADNKSIQKASETITVHNEQTKDEPSISKNDDSKKSEENQNTGEGDDKQVKQDSEFKNNQEDNINETLSENNEYSKVANFDVSEAENEQRMEQQQRREEQIKQNQQQEEDMQHDRNTIDYEGARSKDQIERDESNNDSSDLSDQHGSSQKTVEKEVETQKQDPQHDQHHQTNDNHMDNEPHLKDKKSSNFPVGESSGIPEESKESIKTWSTQADQSDNHKERKKGPLEDHDGSIYGFSWKLCNVTPGADYIPCLDNEKAINKLHRKHFEHRERHCPEEPPTCLVPLPQGYKTPVEWPLSREKVCANYIYNNCVGF